jgi:type I restriction enzyme S subunit
MDEGVFLVTARNIKNGIIDYSLSQEYVAFKDYDEIMSRGIPVLGDVLFTTEAPLGEVAQIDNVNIALAQRIIKFRGKKDILDNTYLKYFILSQEFQDSLMTFATGSTALGIKAERIGYLQQCIPPIHEQTQIAKFLDHETTKIDHLIEKQHQLIELLKEKRQAVISHAVTKGLNPNVPMKDSGVEWLGQVPEHWGITPLKHQVETINGFGFSSNDFCDEGVPFIRAGNIKQKSINNVEIFLPQEIVNKYKRVILSAGDVVISMVGSDPTVKESAVGQIGIIPTHFEGAVPNQNVVILREKKCNLLKKYLFYSLCSTAYRTHLDIFSHKLANQAIISSSLIISAKFTMPRVDEQLEIINYLDNQLLKFDQMMLKAESAIQLMQERRTALISAAVTGKIDVRNWQAPMVAEAQTELSA